MSSELLSNPEVVGHQRNNRFLSEETVDVGSSIVIEKRWYPYDSAGNLYRLVRDLNGAYQEIFWFYDGTDGKLWMSVYGAGEFDFEEHDVSGITLISAAEYRHDGGRQRYMVRLRDPNDDFAIFDSGEWRDYMGNDIHRDYTVDPATGDVTNGASYLAGVGYDDGSANASHYFSADQIGTTRRIADSTGCDNAPPSCSPAILHRKISTAFGEPVSTVNETGLDLSRYGYAGSYGYEEPRSGDPLALLGWLHVGERYYAPELGRFVQRDPIGIRGGLNIYLYATNNPVILVDPFGENSFVSVIEWIYSPLTNNTKQIGDAVAWIYSPLTKRQAAVSDCVALGV